MPDDPFSAYDLHPVELSDGPLFRPFFDSLLDPLSDYTFSQIYTWRNSLHIAWKLIDNHLCVFANGTGDLTLLIPPIGQTGTDLALKSAFELMDDYNAARGVPERSRVEYASEEMLTRFNRTGMDVIPMGTDYVYDTARMIDLAGGDLASKRQAKNRFLRTYTHRVETYDPAVHLTPCLELLDGWRVHQDAHHLEEANSNCIKRQKETIATELALRSAGDLGLKGMVVYAGETTPRLCGFTFGENLGTGSSSIVIEKTDLEVKGLAQFIFSEFCRREWSDKSLTNVGDDWGLESLAWTKMSYRPVRLLQKYALAKTTKVASAGVTRPLVIRPAVKDDLPATIALEKACFSADLGLKKRQLQYLQQRTSAIFLVADKNGAAIGEGIALIRQHKRGVSGRIYSLAVDENHRKGGIGKQLLDAMLATLHDRGATRVYLEVEQANAAAIALYERSGFKSIGILPDYYGGGRSAVHMLREETAPAMVFSKSA